MTSSLNTASAMSNAAAPETTSQIETVPDAANSSAATLVEGNSAEKCATEQEAQFPAGNTSDGESTTDDSTVSGPWITSRQADYPPGALVTLTGGGWIGDSDVKVVIEDSSNEAQSWRLDKDLPAASDGSIELQFNLPGWYVPQYKVTATGLTTGRVATTTFTDTGGTYTFDFSAADPTINKGPYPQTYEKLTPSEISSKLSLINSGRARDPLPDAIYGYPKDSVESLEPADMELGTVVPYEVKISVNGSTSPENGIINFTAFWLTKTTSGDDFGFDPNYKVLAAFVDYGDAASHDPGGNARVDSFSSTVEKEGTSNEQIQGNIQVSGLDNGDTVIVEIWVALKSAIPQKSTGNVQSGFISAATGPIGAAGDTITGGQETIPLNKVGEFFSAKTEVGIVKTDSPDPLYPGDTLTYTITVTNNTNTTISTGYLTPVVANGIVVTDTLDPNVAFVSASDGGTISGNVITWQAFNLPPYNPNYPDDNKKTLTVTVKVNQDAPTGNFTGTSPDNRGSSSNAGITLPDLLNMTAFTMITADLNMNNNIWYEPTNVLPRASITAYKVWVGGPVEDHKPVNMTLYRQVGSGTKEVVAGVTPAITPSTGTSDKFTYTWTGLPMYDSNFQTYIYTVDELTVPDGYTKTITANNTITNIYKPSLTILKVYGTTPLQGAIFELYAGNDSGRTGDRISFVTTGADGKAVFEHLADGTYWLVEAKPPIGYKWINDIGPIKVSNGTIAGPDGFKPAADGATGNYIVTVQNEPVRELPATGGIGTIPFAAGGLGFMMFAIYLGRRKGIDKGISGYEESNKIEEE